MADALGANVERSPDALRAYGFAGMGRQTEPRLLGFLVKISEWFCTRPALVATNADPYNAGGFPL
jgi:hypothetical protein